MSTCLLPTAAVTRDTFWHGRLAVWQPARGHGYRFNLDPILLARFCPEAEVAVELGAGCGILSLLLLAVGKVRQATAVEVQPLLADMARRNAVENGLAGRLHVVQADLREVHGPKAGLVAFNPPYFRKGEGRGSPHPGRDAARREQHGTLADFVACARRLVAPHGTVAAVIPDARVSELQHLCHASGLHLRTSQWVTARKDAAPHLALLAFCPDVTVRPQVLAPLQMHAGAGRAFSAEMAPWVDGTVAVTKDPLP